MLTLPIRDIYHKISVTPHLYRHFYLMSSRTSHQNSVHNSITLELASLHSRVQAWTTHVKLVCY